MNDVVDSLVEGDTSFQLLQLGSVEGAGEADGVLPLDSVTRMEDSVRPVPIARQEDEPLRVLIEATDRKQTTTNGTKRRRHELEDRSLRVRIAQRRSHSRRLVDGEIDLGRDRADRSAVHFDLGFLGIDALAECRGTSVNGDPAGRDEFLTGAPRSNSRRSQDLLE